VKFKKKGKKTGKAGFIQKDLSWKSGRDSIARVRLLAETLCESEGIELVHVEYQPEAGGQTLRLYIDKDGGITMDDCAYISRQVGDLLDVSTEDLPPYNLEVSSPGLDRPLGKMTDFEKYRGKIVSIKTVRSVDGRRNFKGVLQGVVDTRVNIRLGDKTVAIPFKEISKARLVTA